MEALVGETVRLDPKEQERKKEERKMIFDLFPETIYMQELPNGYCSKSCCSQRPWYRVTTVRGHIKIGWRKRVIEIDWTESGIKARAEELFPNEKVTKMDRGIHAWSYEDARRYLRYILGAE